MEADGLAADQGWPAFGRYFELRAAAAVYFTAAYSAHDTGEPEHFVESATMVAGAEHGALGDY